MFITLKLLHMFALLLGGAATLGPIVLQRSVALSGQTTPAPSTPLALRALGITGLLAILILWVTGLMMLSQGYDGASFGIWFAIKMLAATAILLAAITPNRKARKKPAAKTIRRMVDGITKKASNDIFNKTL